MTASLPNVKPPFRQKQHTDRVDLGSAAEAIRT
jgi:hypothetical protein